MRAPSLRLFFAAVGVALLATGPAAAQNIRITGAGASFPFPLYASWFQAYSAQTPGIRIDYQSTGSGAGVRSFMDRTVNFAGSDAAMTDEEITQVAGGVVVLPSTAGKVVLAFNLPGVTELKLPREVYPLIFTGEINKWNDPRIAEANPGVELPDQTITVVRRSDGAGTTFIFTNHMAAISESFAEKIGVGTTVQWPNLPNIVGAPRNDGVMATTMQTPGAIGFVEYGFAQMSGTPMASLQNAAGEFVHPSNEAGTAALASGDFSGEDLRVWVADPSDAAAYPITSMTWLLFYKEGNTPEIQAALRDFMVWAMGPGQDMAAELNYVPLPAAVKEQVLKQIPLIQ
jgi:phosphate transport system substrate-binding protein